MHTVNSFQWTTRVPPGADRAIVSVEKVRDFLLSPVNPRARGKAAFFQALGFTVSNWEVLRSALLEIARSGDADAGQKSEFGAKYEVRAAITRWPPGSRHTAAFRSSSEGGQHDRSTAKLVVVSIRDQRQAQAAERAELEDAELAEAVAETLEIFDFLSVRQQ